MTTSNENDEPEFTSHDVEMENAPTEYERAMVQEEWVEPVKIKPVPDEEALAKELSDDMKWSIQWKIEGYHKKVKFIPMHRRLNDILTEWVEVERLKLKHISDVSITHSYDDYPMIAIYLGREGRMEHVEWLIKTLASLWEYDSVGHGPIFGELQAHEDVRSMRLFKFKKDDKTTMLVEVMVSGSNHCKVTTIPTGEMKEVTTSRIDCDDDFAIMLTKMEQGDET